MAIAIAIFSCSHVKAHLAFHLWLYDKKIFEPAILSSLNKSARLRLANKECLFAGYKELFLSVPALYY